MNGALLFWGFVVLVIVVSAIIIGVALKVAPDIPNDDGEW